MRCAVIGTGRIGTLHATTLRNLDQVEQVVLADADPGRARALAAELRIDAVDTVDEVYSSGVDGVIIAAATNAHAELIHQALERGVPAFCEKPVAVDLAGTQRVLEHATEVGMPLQIGFQRRFDNGYRKAREALRTGQLGWLHTLRAVTGDAEPPPPGYIPGSGGLFRDCGIHDFDILRWLTGHEVVSVYAMGANRGAEVFRASGDVDTGAAILEFDDGTLATASSTRYNGAGYDVRLEVCGSTAAIFVGNDEHAPLPSAEAGIEWPTGKPYQTFIQRFGGAYVAEIETFVQVVAGHTENPCTADDALKALHIAEACELSRHRGQPVEIDEVHDSAL